MRTVFWMRYQPHVTNAPPTAKANRDSRRFEMGTRRTRTTITRPIGRVESLVATSSPKVRPPSHLPNAWGRDEPQGQVAEDRPQEVHQIVVGDEPERNTKRGRKARMAAATTGVHGSRLTRRIARNTIKTVEAPSAMLGKRAKGEIDGPRRCG